MKAEKVWIDTQFDKDISWGLSLVGRAPALHAGGQEFDSPSLHQYIELKTEQLEISC